MDPRTLGRTGVHVTPLGTDHTTLTGRYRVLLPALLHDRGAYRPLNTPEGAAAA